MRLYFKYPKLIERGKEVENENFVKPASDMSLGRVPFFSSEVK